MARLSNKLSAAKVAKLNKTGLYGDGNGLYLSIRGEAKSWIFRYAVGGKQYNVGLGALHTVSLAEARAKALDCRKMRLVGVDPLEQKRLELPTKRTSPITFGECAKRYFQARHPEWSRTTRYTREVMFNKHVLPKLGKLAVRGIGIEHVMKVLADLEDAKPDGPDRAHAA